MVTINEYFRYVLQHELLTNLKFYYTTMTIPLQNHTDYFKIENDKYFVLMDNEYREVAKITTDRPLLRLTDPITLFNADMSCIPQQVDTTIGRAIVNYILLEYNFKDKIEYMNRSMATGDIEQVILENLKSDKITVPQYLGFIDGCSLLQGLSRITTISATPKTITPPPNIISYKKELIKEFNKNYGNNWVKDPVKVIEFEAMLKAKDEEYLADDPTNNILTSKKVKDNARTKMYLTMGSDVGFALDNEPPEVVFNSLLEGYPEDRKQLTAIFNASRAGSYSRGNETKEGGVAAKVLLRTTSNITIEPGDCKSDIYKEVYVTSAIAESLIGRYMKTSNGITKIENSRALIGKTIMIRSPQYCRYTNKTYCATCVGDNLANYRKGVTTMATDISSTIMKTALKKMHTAAKSLIKSSPIEMLK